MNRPVNKVVLAFVAVLIIAVIAVAAKGGFTSTRTTPGPYTGGYHQSVYNSTVTVPNDCHAWAASSDAPGSLSVADKERLCEGYG